MVYSSSENLTEPTVQLNENQDSVGFFMYLCHEPFWNHSSAWESPTPEFGSCVERTVLIWGPCGFLWLLAPFYIILLKQKPFDRIPWSALSYTKLLLSLVMIITGLVELAWAALGASRTPPPVDFLAPVVLLTTYVIHITLVSLGRLHGNRNCGLLWSFWFLMMLCGIPQFITSVRAVIYLNGELPAVVVVTFIVQYFSGIALFITNWFSDEPSKLQRLTRPDRPSPELSASFPSNMMYWWSFPFIWLGFKRPLLINDLWNVRQENSALSLSKLWQEHFERIHNKPRKESSDRFEVSGKKVAVARTLWRMVRRDYLPNALLYVIAEAARFITPTLLSLLIQLITDTNKPSWHGYVYAIGLLIVCEFSSIVKNRYFYNVVIFSLQIRSALMSAVYSKALKLSGSARRESTIGQIVNMMAVDTQMIGDTTHQFCNMVGAPAVILVSMILLWQRLGPSILAGLAILVLLTPVNSLLANETKKCQYASLKIRDKRVKMASEIINGIKVLKLYAWEESFAKQVQGVRDDEIRILRKIAYLQSFSSFVFLVSPYLVSLATFATYLLVSDENILNAELAFVSISLFNIMKLPMTQMPTVVAMLIHAHVALKRMTKFLSSGELDAMAVCYDSSEDGHLVIHNGRFSWEGAEGEATWSLVDVEMKVNRGKLAAVVGAVGAGKSSLISALLGEMKKESGKVVVNGSMAYVSQQAWLQNASLRDNVTWGQPFDDEWYRKVVKACALEPDLEMLQDGDMTEIGEKGINLSGGQKQRISLARAVYRDADIILLDDPLSAVDAHVGKHIFEHVIGPNGLLKSKTRLLVTHAVTFLPQVDEVIVIKDGCLVEKGTYPELISADGDFANFIVQYVTSCDGCEVDEELLELRDHLEGAPRAEILRQISQMSSSNNSCTSLSGQPVRGGGRQRSVSENQEGPFRDGSPPYNSCSQLPQSNGSLTFIPKDKTLLQRQISKSSGFSRNGIQRTYSSRSSIHSKGLDHQVEMKALNGTALKSSDPAKQVNNKGNALVQDELEETGKVARHVYLVYAKAMGLTFAITPVVALSLGQASVAGSNVWLSMWSTSGASDGSGTMNTTTEGANITDISNDAYGTISRDAFLAGYGAFGIAQAIFLFIGMISALLGCLKAGNTMHQSLLSTVIRLPMSFFDTNPSGRIINRFSKEINVLDYTLPNTIRGVLSCTAQVIATMIVIVGSTPITAIFILPIMAVYYFIQVVYVATSRQLKRIESNAKAPIYSHFSESIQGASVIRAFRKQDEFYHASLSKIDNYLKAVYINVGTNRWVAVHLETLGNLITFAAAIMAVVGRETISPGIVGLSITYSLNVTLVLNWLVRIASDLEAHIVSVERINQYLQIDQEAAWWIEDKAPHASWPENGTVSFNHYETRYRPGLELVLKGITCSFKPAEKVGIVGRTGAGKSSLTLALFRLIESSGGNIDIDNTKIAGIGLHDLRSRISIIPQDPVLFSGTLRMNLDPFDARSDADIWQALSLAHLSDYVRSLPLGLQHQVDEDGSNFSVGQRQLVCLARALLRNSRILVLDEATAAVDLETDDLIQATIRDQFRECTVLTIAHRLNTIMDCDRVLVLDQGMVAEFDTPAALLDNSSSIFHGMAKDAGII